MFFVTLQYIIRFFRIFCLKIFILTNFNAYIIITCVRHDYGDSYAGDGRNYRSSGFGKA